MISNILLVCTDWYAGHEILEGSRDYSSLNNSVFRGIRPSTWVKIPQNLDLKPKSNAESNTKKNFVCILQPWREESIFYHYNHAPDTLKFIAICLQGWQRSAKDLSDDVINLVFGSFEVLLWLTCFIVPSTLALYMSLRANCINWCHVFN